MTTTAPQTKADFYARYQRGEFGNRPRTWSDSEALRASGYDGSVTVRSKEAGGKCRYRVPAREAVAMDGTFNESMPDDLLLIQGEVVRTEAGLQLSYSTVTGLTMREAMRSPIRAAGIAAEMLLRRYLWPASRDDLMELLETYDAVVEFGAYSCAVGDCPRRNTVVWEVRNY